MTAEEIAADVANRQIELLLKTERGDQAARNLLALIEADTLSFDPEQMRALSNLLGGCACGYSEIVRAAIRERLKI